MKIKVILILLLSVIFSGCTIQYKGYEFPNIENDSKENLFLDTPYLRLKELGFTTIDYSTDIKIYVDTYTGVLYYGNNDSIIPIFNADGKPRNISEFKETDK